MASFIDVENLTYCGEEMQRIFSEDIYSLDLRNIGATFMDGVKGKTKIYSGEIGDVLQAYTCPFTPDGEVALDEAFIEPAALKVNLEECYDKFWNTFLVDQTEISLRGGIPQTFSEWFFAKLRERMKENWEELFWKGDTDYTGSTKAYIKVIDGIEKQLDEASGATHITGAAITVANVLSQVEATIQSGMSVAAAADVDTRNYKVMMNYADIAVLKMALGQSCCPNDASIFSNYAKGANGEVYIYGFEVVPTKQSRNTIIFGPVKNLIVGYDTFDSHLEWKFIDMRNSTGDNMFRIISISNIAAGIVLPQLFTISKP